MSEVEFGDWRAPAEKFYEEKKPGFGKKFSAFLMRIRLAKSEKQAAIFIALIAVMLFTVSYFLFSTLKSAEPIIMPTQEEIFLNTPPYVK